MLPAFYLCNPSWCRSVRVDPFPRSAIASISTSMDECFRFGTHRDYQRAANEIKESKILSHLFIDCFCGRFSLELRCIYALLAVASSLTCKCLGVLCYSLIFELGLLNIDSRNSLIIIQPSAHYTMVIHDFVAQHISVEYDTTLQHPHDTNSG